MKVLIVIIVAVIILAGGSYLFLSQKISSPSSTGTNVISPLPTSDISDLQQGGSSYKDSQNVYTFLYPSNYTLDESDKQHIRIYKKGATQKGQTEMYDGVLMVFETINLNGSTLSNWIDNNIKTTTADGTLHVIEPKKAFKVGNYSGFTYTTRGLGEATYYVLQKDSGSPYAVSVTTAVNDPEKVGFQEEVNKILATIQILK